ncbi:MAG: hypothetical protein ACM31L_13590 [Actinomycetota bacterium]
MRRLAAALLLMLVAAAAAAAAECPPKGAALPATTVAFETSVAEPVWTNSRGIDEITALLGRRRVPGGAFFDGLTRLRTELELAPVVRSWPLPGGRTCAVAGPLTARWRIAETTVDVAREYPPGSCQYAAVARHEATHVALNRHVFDSYAPQLEARLKAVVAALGPVVVEGGREAANAMVLWRLGEGVRPLREAFERERAQANAGLDTAQSYRAVKAQCPRW